jgi:hypothetical protein
MQLIFKKICWGADHLERKTFIESDLSHRIGVLKVE